MGVGDLGGKESLFVKSPPLVWEESNEESGQMFSVGEKVYNGRTQL